MSSGSILLVFSSGHTHTHTDTHIHTHKIKDHVRMELKMAIYKLRKETSEEMNPVDIWISEF
jgi:hypothetical protein